MAEEISSEVPIESKAKSPVVKIVILLLAAIFVLAAAVVGTLFMTGFFSQKAIDSEEMQPEHGSGSEPVSTKGAHPKAGEHDKKGSNGKSDKKDASLPQKKAIPADAQARFEKSYMELDDKKPLVANIANSRKVMQVSLSLMTQYDDRVFQNVEKHRAALRSVALDTLRQVSESELLKPEFRSELANKLRDRINAELLRLENFGGIEEVFFTEFVYQ